MRRSFGKGNRANSIIKMREEVGNSVRIFKLDEDNALVECVIEAVEVDEENSCGVGILNLSDFAEPWVRN